MCVWWMKHVMYINTYIHIFFVSALRRAKSLFLTKLNWGKSDCYVKTNTYPSMPISVFILCPNINIYFFYININIYFWEFSSTKRILDSICFRQPSFNFSQWNWNQSMLETIISPSHVKSWHRVRKFANSMKYFLKGNKIF